MMICSHSPKTHGRKRASKRCGCRYKEIRIRDASGTFHCVMYLAKFEEGIYVLHCFQKKTQATSKQDKAIAAARYRAVVNGRREKK